MREIATVHTEGSFSMKTLFKIIRAIGASIGLIVMVTGLVYIAQIFTMILTLLQTPDVVEEHIETWANAVGGEGLNIIIGTNTYECANIIAILVVGTGFAFLTWIAISLIRIGAKSISWTLGDRAAIKNILQHAFGNKTKPEPSKGVGGSTLKPAPQN